MQRKWPRMLANRICCVNVDTCCESAGTLFQSEVAGVCGFYEYADPVTKNGMSLVYRECFFLEVTVSRMANTCWQYVQDSCSSYTYIIYDLEVIIPYTRY